MAQSHLRDSSNTGLMREPPGDWVTLVTTPKYSSNELSLTVGRDLGDLKKYNEVASAVQPPAPGCTKWPLGWNSPARQNRFEGVVPTRITPHKHCPTFIPPCSTTHKSKCNACEGKLPASIQKLPMIISRNYSFCFPILIFSTVGITRRRGWEKRRESTSCFQNSQLIYLEDVSHLGG